MFNKFVLPIFPPVPGSFIGQAYLDGIVPSLLPGEVVFMTRNLAAVDHFSIQTVYNK